MRLRAARGAGRGLSCRTHAGLRVATGCDVIALLFSTNALRLLRPTDRVPQERQRREGG
ncbi:hypothetical protein ruthe_01063 [Rubellimicrobium thermophilum DSM 16684]|uniref:Uncharacterized protein n=1 Tax=Rubellimicrobium thermophilum DSM 16684 TaxID=1123069 RepID=S9R2W8_9RHOB|nr:hypothetical protein [Rubellimicrobium thermophilum]EPX86252.1 hypothetical protein ruthe_01063 [Rubellimicrobium thermophilum DSM 16684]